MKDFYRILEIPKTAEAEDIRLAYRRLAMQYHPDKNTSPEAEAKFRDIHEAYKILSNSDTKQAYDNKLLTAYMIITQQQEQETRTVGSTSKRRKRKIMNDDEREVFRKAKLKKQENFYRRQLRWGRPLSLFTLLFSLLIVIDRFLPFETFTERVISRSEVVVTQHCKFPLDTKVLQNALVEGEMVTIQRTPLFNNGIWLHYNHQNKVYSYEPLYSIYSVFAFVLIVFLLTSFLGAFWGQRDAVLAANAGYINIIWFFITCFVM